ncbi:hypothetical protein PENTCL1PPCAC_9695 [Pristionchus entomophagus]|uniref:F-box domain-containing protein n=1 Tax=Pristionchus entomophagus TaxID=358040 RepID=A0AAV5SXN8_9BILA|nr:hypothetical protein PENTCL1PPCAC_9695 [Pristionchus entomophagus]
MKSSQNRGCESEECALNEAKRTKLSIHGEADQISTLPDDIVSDIITRLDHYDLDQVAMLSRRLYVFSHAARSKARKLDAKELQIFKASHGKQCIHLRREAPAVSHCMIINRSGEKKIMKYTGTTKLPICKWNRDSKLRLSIKRAAFLMNRHTIVQVSFACIRIDHKFVSVFESAFHDIKAQILRFHHASVDSSENPEISKRLLNLFVGAKPKLLHLNIEGLIIDEDFLRSYAESVPLPQFSVSFYDDGPKHIFCPDSTFSSSLSSFRVLQHDHLLVDADWILPAIIDRLRRQLTGVFSCSVSRLLHKQEIADQVDEDIEYLIEAGKVVLRLPSSNHSAKISFHHSVIDHPTCCSIKVHFVVNTEALSE